MQNFLSGLKTKKAITAIIVVVIVAGYFFYRAKNTKSVATQYVTQAVTKGAITVSVSGTGQVVAQNSIDIKPQTSGSVTAVFIKPGQSVKAGQTLITLDQKNAASGISQAQASLESAQANYQKVIQGVSSTDTAVNQAALDSAQLNVTNAEKNLTLVKQQQQTNVANSYSNLLNAGLAAVPSGGSSSQTPPTITGSYNDTVQGEYKITLYQTGSGLHYQTSGLEVTDGIVTAAYPQPLGTKGLYIQFPAGTLNSGNTWTVQIPNTQSNNYLENYNSYQTALQNQTQALANAQTSIDSAKLNLTSAQASYASKQAPPLASDVASARAQVDSAQANLRQAQNTYSNTIITAPFDGQISTVAVQKGDQATASVATEITKQNTAQITLNEVDASKVAVGQKATLTFSALPGTTLTGTVIEISAVGTVSQNVVSFTVKISLDVQNDQVKPGMSVTAAIITAADLDVLVVPSSAVHTTNTESYVETLVNGQPTQIPVTKGLSNNTQTEIAGDIREGDQVVTQTITASAAKTTPTSTGLLQSIGGGAARGGTAGGGRTFTGGAGGGTGR